jgi:hypothetical protein
MAKALALRGEAHRKQGKPAQAIADLQSALWLKGGLSDSERTIAMASRAAAYRDAGLGDPPPGPGSHPKSAGQTKAAAPAPASKTVQPQASNVTTAAVPAPPAPRAPAQVASKEPQGGSGGFFANLFGGQSAAPVEAASSPKAPASPAVSSWSEENAKPKSKSPPPRLAAAAPPAVQATKAATPTSDAEAAKVAPDTALETGRFHIRLAAQRTEGDAKAISRRVINENAAEVAGRKVAIDEAVFGGMGTFYRATIGPYADVEAAKKLCAQIRGQGVDCQVISR